MGAALTWELARRSLRVILLEGQGIAGGVSGSSFAWINATAKSEDETYHRLNARAVVCWHEMAAQWGAEALGLHGGGALFWERETQERQRLRERYTRLQAWDYPVCWVTTSEIAALEPAAQMGEGAEGLFAPADMWLETARCCRFLLEQARQLHADIRPHCPALGFTRSITDAISTVETPQGRIATRLLVLAAGLKTSLLAAQAGGLEAAHGCPLREEPGLLVELESVPASARIGRVCYPPDVGGLHMRPTLGGGLLLGAEDVDAQWQRPDRIGADGFPVGAVEELVRRAKSSLPVLASGGFSVAPRCCVRPVPLDDRPIVGALQGAHHLYVAVTHSGVTLAPLLAQLLAEEIVIGRPSPLLAPFAPARFRSEEQPER